MDEVLTPAPLSDKVLERHPIFQVPIIVVPGLNHNAVRMQLETLLMQPGIRTEMVTVSCPREWQYCVCVCMLVCVWCVSVCVHSAVHSWGGRMGLVFGFGLFRPL